MLYRREITVWEEKVTEGKEAALWDNDMWTRRNASCSDLGEEPIKRRGSKCKGPGAGISLAHSGSPRSALWQKRSEQGSECLEGRASLYLGLSPAINLLGELGCLTSSLWACMCSHLRNGPTDRYCHHPDSQGSCEGPREENVSWDVYGHCDAKEPPWVRIPGSRAEPKSSNLGTYTSARSNMVRTELGSGQGAGDSSITCSRAGWSSGMCALAEPTDTPQPHPADFTPTMRHGLVPSSSGKTPCPWWWQHRMHYVWVMSLDHGWRGQVPCLPSGE